MTPEPNAVSRTEADYNDLPYPSLPVAYTQPAAMAAMLQIFGVGAAQAATARVLELGCASGGNIVPLAARFPQAQFLGVDISQRQVDEANRRVATLGLKNINVERGDLTARSFGRETFDFIICHGVYSWVPPAAQQAIWRICGESLAPKGTAAISFNVLPGWHLRRVVRDICLLDLDPNEAPLARVEKARAALGRAAAANAGGGAYAALLRGEAERLAKMPSSYWMGEFLAEDNHPVSFDGFVARAGEAGLCYVCEGEAATALPEYFFPAAAKQIRTEAGGDAHAVQRLTDIYSGRPFRRALLVRAGRGPAQAQIDWGRLKALHFAADIRRGGDGGFRDAKGRALSPQDAMAADILARLAEAYPSTLTLAEMLGAHAAETDAERRALALLLQLMGAEQATISTVPLKVGRADDATASAWAVARLDAAARQPWATSLHHQAVRLSPVLRRLLPLMDGRSKTEALRNAVADVAGDETKADEVLRATLAYAARQGLIAL